jgi:hypothetical protein
MITSAMGERQMLPVHTKHTRKRAGAPSCSAKPMGTFSRTAPPQRARQQHLRAGTRREAHVAQTSAMNPLAVIALENALQVRGLLLAQASAVWIAGVALDRIVVDLPPDTAPEWRGPAARAEARRVREVRERIQVARARLRAAADLIARDTLVVDIHVG